MKKAPLLLAALPLIAACDDGQQIQELLKSSKVADTAAAVQDACIDIMQEGTTQLDSGEGVDFTAEFDDSWCQCSRSPDSCITRRWMSLDTLISSDENHASISEQGTEQGTKQGTFMEVYINPDQECLVRTQDYGDNKSQDLKSKMGDVVEACRSFIGRISNTIAAIRNRSIEFSKSKK